jgi:hypothetical protein
MKLLVKNPVKYEIDPKVIFNRFKLNFKSARFLKQKNTIGLSKPMKNKLKTRHLIL